MEVEKDEFEAAYAEASSAKRAEVAPPQGNEPAQAAPAEPAQNPTPPDSKAEPKAESDVDELKRQRDEALHRERSVANRISTVDRQNNELKDSMAALQRKIQELEAAKAAPPSQPAQQANDVLSDAPDLEASIRRRIEEAVAPMAKRLEEAASKAEAAQRGTRELAGEVEPMRNERQQQELQKTWEELDKRFTTSWRDEIRSEDFSGWIKSAPKFLQDAYQTGRSPRESAAVLAAYYSDTGKSPTAQAAPAAPAQSDTNIARLRQSAGVAPRSSPLPKTKADPNDFDSAFAEALAARKQA